MGALPPGSYCNPPTKRLCYPGHLSAVPSLGLSFPIFRTRLVTDSSNLGPHGWKQCRTGPRASQRSCLFCQPKCQQGPVVSEVPPDKGRFAPRGRVGGRSAVPLPSASRGPPLRARRVGRFLLSHPAPPQPAGVSPSPPSPALTPFLGRSQHPGSDSCVRGEGAIPFYGGDRKSLEETTAVFGGAGGAWWAVCQILACRITPLGEGPLSLGFLPGICIRCRKRRGTRRAWAPFCVYLLREVCPGRSVSDPGFASAAPRAERQASPACEEDALCAGLPPGFRASLVQSLPTAALGSLLLSL